MCRYLYRNTNSHNMLHISVKHSWNLSRLIKKRAFGSPSTMVANFFIYIIKEELIFRRPPGEVSSNVLTEMLYSYLSLPPTRQDLTQGP